MKNLLSISAILLLCVFASCSKSDDSDGGLSNSELILANWIIESRTVNGTPDVFEECDAFFQIRFSGNLDFQSTEFSGVDCNTRSFIPGTYTLNGNTLIVMQSGETITGEILTLNENNLSIRFTIDQTVVENYRKP